MRLAEAKRWRWRAPVDASAATGIVGGPAAVRTDLGASRTATSGEALEAVRRRAARYGI
jgi:hypothetical protein